MRQALSISGGIAEKSAEPSMIESSSTEEVRESSHDRNELVKGSEDPDEYYGKDVTLKKAYSLSPDEADLQRIATIASQIRSEDQKYEVAFHESANDPEDLSRTLSKAHKYYISSLITLTSTIITMISSCWALVAEKFMVKFHISREVSVLGITFYIFGLGVGPLLLAPFSELVGRRITFIFSLTLSVIWQCLVTWSTTIEGVFFGRFLSGFFGSAFLSVAGGAISDIFNKDEVGIPITLYTLSVFFGPSLAPIIAGAFAHDDYRWTFIVLLIACGVCLILIIFTIPETYAPILLIKKAARLRKETGNDRYFAPLEVTRREVSILPLVLASMKRPICLLFGDVMMAVLCFYTGLVLAIIYLYFVAFPYIFPKLYNFTVLETGLAYLGLMIGMIVVSPACLVFQKRYERKIEANNGERNPEMRFEPLFYGAFLTPAGLMIFAWTCYPHVHWIAPIIGSGVFGAGVFFVFVGVFGYTVDAYRRFAATAMACNSFVRSTMSGVFPLFGLQMYKGLGINWAGFLLAMVAVVMIPIPFVFSKYGAYLRSKSPYAWDD